MAIATNTFQITGKDRVIYPLYLVYSLFYFFPLLSMGAWLEGKGPGWWIAMFGLYAVFVGTFFAMNRANGRQVQWLMAGLLILLTLGSNITVGTSALFSYMPYFFILLLPSHVAWRWFVACVLGILVASWMTSFVWYFWAPAMIVFAFNTFGAVLEHQKKRLSEATEKAAHLAERERIAHNLHDVTGHQLTAIALKAQLACKLIQANEYDQASDELAMIAKLAAENRAAIRSVIEDEWPRDLLSSYEDLVNLLKTQGFEWQCTGELPTFVNSAEYEITAIFTEAVTNVLRHASDKRVQSRHLVTPEGYEWRIANPAVGVSDPKGMGLVSMKRRAESLGGSLAFQLTASGEAILSLRLPLSVIQTD